MTTWGIFQLFSLWFRYVSCAWYTMIQLKEVLSLRVSTLMYVEKEAGEKWKGTISNWNLVSQKKEIVSMERNY